MLTHDVRVKKIVDILRTRACKDAWKALYIPCVGTVFPHVVSQEEAKTYNYNEVWVRFGSPEVTKATSELRGSAEMVAKQICKLLRAPSKAVDVVASKLAGQSFDGLREPEIAVAFDLDEDLVFQAMSLLDERGLAVNHGAMGWFRRSV